MKNQTTKFQTELLLVSCALFLFPVQILIGATISVSGGGFFIPSEPNSRIILLGQEHPIIHYYQSENRKKYLSDAKYSLGTPSKKKKTGFKDIVPKGGRGSGPNPKICCM